MPSAKRTERLAALRRSRSVDASHGVLAPRCGQLGVGAHNTGAGRLPKRQRRRTVLAGPARRRPKSAVHGIRPRQRRSFLRTRSRVSAGVPTMARPGTGPVPTRAAPGSVRPRDAALTKAWEFSTPLVSSSLPPAEGSGNPPIVGAYIESRLPRSALSWPPIGGTRPVTRAE
jgi:hypothetical protein